MLLRERVIFIKLQLLSGEKHMAHNTKLFTIKINASVAFESNSRDVIIFE